MWFEAGGELIRKRPRRSAPGLVWWGDPFPWESYALLGINTGSKSRKRGARLGRPRSIDQYRSQVLEFEGSWYVAQGNRGRVGHPRIECWPTACQGRLTGDMVCGRGHYLRS